MIRLLLTSTALIASLCGSASAMTVIVSLPELVGEVLYTPHTGQEVAFDAHQQFSSIETVSIEIEAHAYAREFDYCGSISIPGPQPCIHQIHLDGFLARMDKEESPVLGTIFTDGLAFSEDPQALEAYGVDTAPFRNTRIGWDFLLDGRGSLTLYWNYALSGGGFIIQNIQDPSGEILSARLIIEGTPIPEPSSGLLIAIGLSTLSLHRNSRYVDQTP